MTIYMLDLVYKKQQPKKGTKTMMSNELQAKVVKLQEKQRKADDAGDVTLSDELQKKIEYFYHRYNRDN